LQLETAFGWVFPEHRDIAVLALQRLSPEQQASFQKLWSEARAGHESPCAKRRVMPHRGPSPIASITPHGRLSPAITPAPLATCSRSCTTLRGSSVSPV
jgi:hypothetical protein